MYAYRVFITGRVIIMLAKLPPADTSRRERIYVVHICSGTDLTVQQTSYET